jgi:PhzF family phenazine biosynthesis protein
MTARPFKQVDVFTRRPFLGNPVAVVLDAHGLSDAEMAAIARWTNLSETTFVLPSDWADYRLRIFSPGGELPFAGHPTIGSAHAVLEAGLVTPRDGHFTQECGIGVVPLARDPDGTIRATVPMPRVVADDLDASALAQVLGLAAIAAPMVLDTGAVWIVARAPDVGALLGAKTNPSGVAEWSDRLHATGVTVYAVAPDGEVHVRSFAPGVGVPEDPVCGSGNLCVAAHLARTGGLAETGDRYTSRQGQCLGRDGRIEIRVSDAGLSLGGAAVTVIDGRLFAGDQFELS